MYMSVLYLGLLQHIHVMKGIEVYGYVIQEGAAFIRVIADMIMKAHQHYHLIMRR
jgi:hypothetical protein